MVIRRILVLLVLVLAGCKGSSARHDAQPLRPFTLVVSSFGEDISWQEDLSLMVENSLGLQLNCILVQDAKEAMQKILTDSLTCDMWMGINNAIAPMLPADSIFAKCLPQRRSVLEKRRSFTASDYIIPYGYSYVGILYDTLQVHQPPSTFGELQDGVWQQSILLPDARYSSVGNSMVQWSNFLFGNNGYRQFWLSIRNNIYRITPSWQESFYMLLADEAPMAVGLITAAWGYQQQEHTGQYKSLVMQEGGWLWLEGAAIMKQSPYQHEAAQIMEYLLSEGFQAKVATELWLIPVDTHVAMITGIHDVVPQLEFRPNADEIQKTNTYWIQRWKKILL
jgi:thiamine transport system substrate-binding protein